ncbi:MAG TPA: response regulator transcription factor [Bdellovibrionales bacterium]|nr:response regulator transcription factor [Bdellovibrionales bacterium]
MSRLLLVEDDSTLGETLRERLEKEGYTVRWVETQAAAELVFEKETFDLILFDVGLPDGSGFDLARKLRAKKPTPFVFITAMNSAEHRLEGYEAGAEEFIPKPFHLKELLMRVRHVLGTHAALSELKLEDRTIDFNSQAIVMKSGEKEFVPARDFELLKLLVQSSPRVVSRDEILDRVWGEDRFPNQRTIDNAIVRLRHALGESGSKCIRSVRGVGYQWEAEGDHRGE